MDIVKTYGQCCNLVIPKAMADYYGINYPGHVVLEYRKDGIFLRKLVVLDSSQIQTWKFSNILIPKQKKKLL